QLGVVDGSGATGTGTVSLGVTPDLQAWSDGAANHGWLFTGWTDNTDGTQFSPSESTVVANRPRLRVAWLPPGVQAATFRQGLDGYAGATDTQLLQQDPTGDQSFNLSLFSDAADNNNESQVLLQFGNLVGTNPGQIPAGAQIHAAALTLGSTVSDAMGDGGQFYPMLQAWTDFLTNWDSWGGNGVQPDGIEAVTTPSVAAGNASRSPDVQGAFNPFDVTADVQAWVSGTRENYGWAILPWSGGTNGWGFASSEATEGDPGLGLPNERPQLRVFYTPAGITVTPTAGLVTSETGQQATFTVRLDTPPAADVTIALSSSNTQEGTVAPASLTFTPENWNLPQTVTVTGVDDAVVDGPVAYTIVTQPAVSTDPAYNNRDAADVAATNTDNDAPGITVQPTSGLTTTEAGGTATFTVVLTFAPTHNVTIGLSSSDTTEGTVAPASLTFTSANWNAPQTVTVTGQDDPQIDGPVAYTIVTAPAVSNDPGYNNLDADDVAATNLDNDAAGFVVTPTSGLVTTEAGATATFTVALTAQPSDSVSFPLSSSNTLEGTVSPASLTFAPGNWNVPQTVTVTGVNDFIEDGAVPYTVVLDAAFSFDANFNGLNPPDVSVTNLDVNPKVTLPSGETRYGLGDGGIGIDGRATVVDLDSANFSGGTLTVRLTASGTADDRLEIRNEGTGAGQIGVAGAAVSYGGTPIGTWAGGLGTTPLTVALNANATPAATQALLRAVTFRNVAVVPSLNPRTVQVTLTDGSGGTSVPASKTISLGVKRVYQFQEGVDSGFAPYTGAADIQLFQGQPGTAYPTGNTSEGLMVVADAGTNNSQVLLRFDGLFGTGAGQIPPGSLITAATLVLDVNNGGNGPRFHRMLTGWDANADTWNAFGNGAAPRNATGGVQADGAEARTAFDATLNVAGGAA
ncbi:MAG: DNRLRE domain-containing protein, partial [Planctomycetes bacterium]|nr:DNRLRE domain-containing protein [Planctomycetota bacterium]